MINDGFRPALVGTGAAAQLDGTLLVDGNDGGILSVAGKVLLFADVTTSNQTIGLFATNHGTLRLGGGTNLIEGNVLGVLLDAGSFLQIAGATSFTGNLSIDFDLRLGTVSRVFGVSDPGLLRVSCGNGAIAEGGITCP